MMTDEANYIPKRGWLPDWGNVTYCDREYTPVYYRICLYSSAITLPIDLTGIYFIVKKSPTEMGSYKWLLLGHQMCMFLLDLYLSLLGLPEFTFPIWGCKLHGFLNWIGVPVWSIAAVGLGHLGAVLASVTALFYYRAQIILPHYHVLSHSTRTKAIFYVVNFAVNTVLPAHYTIFIPADQYSAKLEWFKNRICVPQVFFDNDMYVVSFGPEKYYFYFLLYYMVAVISIFVLLALIPIYFLASKSNLMSEATRKAQRMFFVALCVQVLVPFSLGIAPVLVYLRIRHWYFERHVVNSFMLIIEAFHGSCETLLMLAVTAPYRRAILRPKAPVIQLDPKSTSAVGSTAPMAAALSTTERRSS